MYRFGTLGTMRFQPINGSENWLRVLSQARRKNTSESRPNAPKESVTTAIVLTDYEQRSVIHYFCPGVGSRELI